MLGENEDGNLSIGTGRAIDRMDDDKSNVLTTEDRPYAKYVFLVTSL